MPVERQLTARAPAPELQRRAGIPSLRRSAEGASAPAADGTQASDGRAMHALVSRLYPICRSLTGPGVRETLRILQEYIPLEIREVSSGAAVFDWTVPQEWRIRDAYVKDADGRRVVDFQMHNLHVVNYSRPVRTRLRWADLDSHLHSLPERSDWIPYRTSYYNDAWGFCLPHGERLKLASRGDDAEYEVVVDADLVDGSLAYGELYLPGESSDEVLLSCHVCHPSLANDNLSGIAVATWLARRLCDRPRRYSYRFLFVPATIGALTWLSANQASLDKVKHGMVLTLLGAGERLTYKRSRRGAAEIDLAAAHVLRHSATSHRLLDFEPFGYDERQYCSPGFNLPVGCLMRWLPGEYPEYHTSADNLDLVRPEILVDSWATCGAIIDVLERNRTYESLSPHGEPQLGRRGLYREIGGQVGRADIERAVLWTLNLSDGEHALLDIAEQAKLPFDVVARAAGLLLENQLLKEVEKPQAA
jgi:aminopeptidase-like protein